MPEPEQAVIPKGWKPETDYMLELLAPNLYDMLVMEALLDEDQTEHGNC